MFSMRSQLVTRGCAASWVTLTGTRCTSTPHRYGRVSLPSGCITDGSRSTQLQAYVPSPSLFIALPPPPHTHTSTLCPEPAGANPPHRRAEGQCSSEPVAAAGHGTRRGGIRCLHGVCGPWGWGGWREEGVALSRGRCSCWPSPHPPHLIPTPSLHISLCAGRPFPACSIAPISDRARPHLQPAACLGIRREPVYSHASFAGVCREEGAEGERSGSFTARGRGRGCPPSDCIASLTPPPPPASLFTSFPFPSRPSPSPQVLNLSDK